jgi:pentatricopeptide repeat protein
VSARRRRWAPRALHCRPRTCSTARVPNARVARRLLDEIPSRRVSPASPACSFFASAQWAGGSSALATSMDDMFSGKFCAPDVVTFTTLISGYLCAGDHAEALDVLRSLMPRRRCSPTVVSYNCVLKGLFGIGQVDTAMHRCLRK